MSAQNYKLDLKVTADADQAVQTAAKIEKAVESVRKRAEKPIKLSLDMGHGTHASGLLRVNIASRAMAAAIPITKASGMGGIGAGLLSSLAGSGSGAGQALGMLGTIGKLAFSSIAGPVGIAAMAIKTTFNGAVSTATDLLKGFAVAGGMATAAGYGFWKALQPAGQMEQFQMSLEVLLKSADKAKKRLSELTKFSVSTPFELPQIIEATNLMQAFGIYSKRNLNAAGDAAAAFGKDIREVVTSMNYLAAGRGGEAFESLARLGVTREKLKGYGIKFNPKTAELVSGTKEAFDAVIRYFETNFAGMMAKQSKTLFGRASNLSEAIFNAFANGMKGALPYAKGVVQVITDGITAAGAQFAKFDWSKIGRQFLGYAETAKKVLLDAMNPEKRGKAIDFAKGFLSQVPEMAMGLAKGLTADILATGANFFGKLTGNLGTIAALMWEGIKGVFQWAWGGLKEVLTSAWDAMGKQLQDSLSLVLFPYGERARGINGTRKLAEDTAFRERALDPGKINSDEKEKALADKIFSRLRGYEVTTKDAGINELSQAMGLQGMAAAKKGLEGLGKIFDGTVITANTEKEVAKIKEKAAPAIAYAKDAIAEGRDAATEELAKMDKKPTKPKAKAKAKRKETTWYFGDNPWTVPTQSPTSKSDADAAKKTAATNEQIKDEVKSQTYALNAMRQSMSRIEQYITGAA
jgi:hypothetical protein